MSEILNLPAFAKINLSLRVLSKRADGYHELDTVLQTISLHDTVKIAATDEPEIFFSCDDRALPRDQHNLAYRAAILLKRFAAVNRGARIRLEKRIPAHAGLGGGSSNAAVTLLALVHLWKAELTTDDLTNVGSELGADVPFFFFGGTARGTGTGTEITPVTDAPEISVLIVKPSANISTRKAYEGLNAPALTSSEPKTILSGSLSSGSFDILGSGVLHNDFDAVASQLTPEIERARFALIKSGASNAMLAGSGSAVFGIFDNRDAQERAIQTIELEPGWRVFPCKTVGRSRYQAAMGAASEVLARFSGHDAGA